VVAATVIVVAALAAVF
jgi:putative heme transporter